MLALTVSVSRFKGCHDSPVNPAVMRRVGRVSELGYAALDSEAEVLHG